MNQYLPNPCLLGIHLTISTHSGPQVVYHYPPSLVEHISAKQRQRSKKSTAYENDVSDRKTHENNARKVSVGALLTPQSVRSSEYRTPGEEIATSPIMESPGTASIRHKSLVNSDKEEEKNSELDSDFDSSTSGLSDSELSTDYADYSSGSSSSAESLANEEQEMSTSEYGYFNNDPNESRLPSTLSNAMGNSVNSRSSQVKSLRPKSSQISASKLLDIFNKDNGSRRESYVSKLSSVQAGHTTDGEAERESQSDLEFSVMVDKGEINIDEQYFDENIFLDTDKIFGFDAEFVAEFCSPEREMCNTRFEFTVDSFCFLGLPIHVDCNGKWRNSKRRKHTTRSKRSNSTATKGSKSASSISKPGAKEPENHDRSESDNKLYDIDDVEHEDEEKDTSGTHNTTFVKDGLEKNMDMFHVCFVMNPPLVEYNSRVDDMFHYVVARLSLLLRYAEAKSNYVSKECHIILKEKEKILKSSKTYKGIRGPGKKAKYLYQRILAKSSLARALTLCVDKLQRDEIACLEIGEDKVISLQIPIQNEFRVLPNFKLHPVLRGSYLSSIMNTRFLEASPSRDDQNDVHMAEEEDDADDLLNYALLLLDEPTNIIKDLETLSFQDDVGNMILTHLIKQIQPTVALGSYQHLIDDLLGSENDSSVHGIQNSFQTSMLRSCALHLLYRRHARVIIPISSKSTYIVSPLAPIRGYSKDDFRKSEDIQLVDKPLIYQNQEIFKNRFPSLPSLPSFLHLLSAKQPKSFGSIIPSKEHKPIYLGALTWLIRFGYVTQLLSFVCVRVDKQIKMAVDEDLEKEEPKIKKEITNRNQDTMDNVSKDKTDNGERFVERLALQSQSQESQTYQTEEEDNDYAFDEPNMERDYTIILEPERATAIEKRWIFKCIQDQPSDVKILFNKVLKYFNGRTPMESIIVREGISRHDLRKILNLLGRYLVEFHHW